MMKRFGYLVRLGGDAEVSEALDRGVRGAMLPVPRENNEACRRVAMWQHTPQEWREMTLDARRRYRRNRRPQGIGKALLLSCLHAMREMGYAYAIIGSIGPQKYYEKCVGAMLIPDSTPGIYKDYLGGIEDGEVPPDAD